MFHRLSELVLLWCKLCENEFWSCPCGRNSLSRTGLQGAIAITRKMFLLPGFFTGLWQCSSVWGAKPAEYPYPYPLVNRAGSRDWQCKLLCYIWNEMKVSAHISKIVCMTRIQQQCDCTFPAICSKLNVLTHVWSTILINSLSSCYYRVERGYTVCKERGCVFEVVFCKSLEDNQARGWTQAVGREATTTFPLQGRKWGSPWPCLLDWITIVICLLETIVPITNIRWKGLSREKKKYAQVETGMQITTKAFCLALHWNMGSWQQWKTRFCNPLRYTPPCA